MPWLRLDARCWCCRCRRRCAVAAVVKADGSPFAIYDAMNDPLHWQAAEEAKAGTDGRSFLTFEQSNRNRNVRQTQMSLFGALIMIYGANGRATRATFHSQSHSQSHSQCRNQLNWPVLFPWESQHVKWICISSCFVCASHVSVCVSTVVVPMPFAGSENMEI